MRVQDDCDADVPVAEEPLPRIPPGIYEAICHKVEIGISFKCRRSLYIKFRVCEGKYEGTELSMVCTYPSGKIRRRFKLYKQWAIAMGRCPAKGERIGGKAFARKMYEVQVRDTKGKLSDGKPEPDFLRYSIVDSIVKTLVGGKCHA